MEDVPKSTPRIGGALSSVADDDDDDDGMGIRCCIVCIATLQQFAVSMEWMWILWLVLVLG